MKEQKAKTRPRIECLLMHPTPQRLKMQRAQFPFPVCHVLSCPSRMFEYEHYAQTLCGTKRHHWVVQCHITVTSMVTGGHVQRREWLKGASAPLGEGGNENSGCTVPLRETNEQLFATRDRHC